jgi:tripartite-type tricarboxylate transporter receptor subunit TctC
MKKTVAKFIFLLINALFFVTQVSLAQEFPSKPIKIVIPFPPGGGADVLMRPLSKKLSELLGQPIILDNKPGANGNIGADFVAKSLPDGYTLLLGNSSLPISTALYSQMSFDPAKDLTPIAMMVNTPSVLVANPKFKAKSISELIAIAKEDPKKINYSSAGIGSTPHLGMEVLGIATGTQFTHIPYKGGGPAVSALLANEVDILITNTSTVLAQIQAGKLTPLGTTTLKRSPVLSSLPSISETVPGFELNTWYGIFGPAGMSKSVALRLNQAFIQCLNSPEIKQQLIALAYDPDPGSAELLAALLKKDSAYWANVIKITGIKAE